MTPEEVPVTPVPLRREAIVPTSDRGRLAAIVATCSLAGLAGGMALSMLAETHRSAREVRARYAASMAEPVTWLGVQILDHNPRACAGARITRITSGSPAEEIGLRKGDVVVAFDGQRVCDNDHLIDFVRSSDIGDTAELKVRRGADELVLAPTLGVMPPRIRAAIPRDELRR